MICQEFDRLVTDIEDEQTFAEASARHVAGCSICAERLASEARVTHALRALAGADQHREAPSHVEVMARTVWRGTTAARQSATWPTPAASSRQVASSATPWWAAGWDSAAWGAAAWGSVAATVLVAVALGVFTMASWTHESGRATNPDSGVPRPLPTSEPVSRAATAEATTDAHAPTAGVVAPVEPAQPRHGGAAARLSASSSARVSASMRPRAARPATASAAGRATSQMRAAADAFVPFPYAEPLRPTEVRQIVRVAVPQATLLMAGLTTSTPADNVVADIIVGEDGIARGIRIVR